MDGVEVDSPVAVKVRLQLLMWRRRLQRRMVSLDRDAPGVEPW